MKHYVAALQLHQILIAAEFVLWFGDTLQHLVAIEAAHEVEQLGKVGVSVEATKTFLV